MMIIDAKNHGIAKGLEGLDHPSGGRGDRLARLVDAFDISGWKKAHRGPALLNQPPRLLQHLLAGRSRRRGESRDLVALLAAKQIINGHAEGLALDVMERDVDGGNSCLQDAPA